MKWLGYALLVVGSTFVVSALLSFIAFITSYTLLFSENIHSFYYDISLFVLFTGALIFSMLHIYFLLRQAAKITVPNKRIKVIILVSGIFLGMLLLETILVYLGEYSMGNYGFFKWNVFFFPSLLLGSFLVIPLEKGFFLYFPVSLFLFISTVLFAIYKEKKNQKKLT